jgi:DNA-binding GntR family transcriptional regulator
LNQVLVHQSLAERVAQEIRRRIDAGLLHPRERLLEGKLAAELGVSRGPVREALRSLADHGLIVHILRRGYLVAWLTPGFVRDLYSTRLALECLAIQQISQRDGWNLDPLVDALASIGRALRDLDVQAVVTSDLEFHHQLIVAARNDVLRNVYRLVTGPIVPTLTFLVPHQLARLSQQREQAYVRGHRAIFEALGRRDANGAIRLLTDHLHRGMTEVLELISADQAGRGGEDTQGTT